MQFSQVNIAERSVLTRPTVYTLQQYCVSFFEKPVMIFGIHTTSKLSIVTLHG